jgi:hypothetical protein
MLLSLDGLGAPKIEHLLSRYPTARAVCEALEAHRVRCQGAGLQPGSREEGWLFADLLEPGHSRKALSHKLTAFLSEWSYSDADHEGGAAAGARRAWPRPAEPD